MPLERGARLGPYEVVSQIGVGGMGEVYRARDKRIGRDVALKVLSVVDPDRVRRFQQEARAAGKLNHPGVLAVYDVGDDGGRPYVVSELLEGRTLREIVREGPMAPRTAIGFGLQVAHALAAAHDMSIVHRDLKPENLFVKNDGTLKVLDFGIAKLALDADRDAPEGTSTLSMGTTTGTILGTAGYMAPEQVRGERVDYRADLFTLGAILYEMLTGRLAFGGDTAVERMHAVLKAEPPPRESIDGVEPPELGAVIARCLAKDPAARFATARELAQALAGMVDGAEVPELPAPRARPEARGSVPPAALLVGAGVLAVAAFALGRRSIDTPAATAPHVPASAAASAPAPAPPLWRQLTFGNGSVPSARFSPDGRTVVYGAAWGGKTVEVFTMHVESATSRALGLADADVLAVSSTGEMAISRRRRFFWWPAEGTLARVPLVGGTPREMIEGVQDADWSPDGETMAVARRVGRKFRIEYPADTVLYETDGWVSRVRVSPDGKLVAFLDHPFQNDDMGDVAVVGLDRQKRTLATGWMSEQGIAWSARGDEVWFSAAPADGPYGVYAVTLEGERRLVMRGPTKLLLQDVSRDGRVLVSHDGVRGMAMAKGPTNAAEVDVSSNDLSVVAAIAGDGQTVMISEQSGTGAKGYDIYLRSLDGAAPLRVGAGMARDLSSDGKRTLALPYGADDKLVVFPNGAGEAITLSHAGLKYRDAAFLPDARSVVVLGEQAGRRRWYEQSVGGGEARALSAEGSYKPGAFVSPSGKRLAFVGDDGLWMLALAGGETKRVASLESSDGLAGWTEDERSVFVLRRGEHPASIDRVDVTTGRREPWKRIAPADPAGFVEVSVAHVAPDGKAYAYTFLRVLSTLYIVQGLN